MIKTKYDVLSKEEKKQTKKEFFNTNLGKKIKKAILSSKICAILCSLCGIYIIVDNYVSKSNSITNYIYGSGVFVIGIILVLYARKIVNKRLSLYIAKNKK